MTKAELGKGGGGIDTINVFDAKACSAECLLRHEDTQFRCIKHNGDATVIITGGVTRSTLSEFILKAPCMEDRKTNKL
jgi:hypothetical protein